MLLLLLFIGMGFTKRRYCFALVEGAEREARSPLPPTPKYTWDVSRVKSEATFSLQTTTTAFRARAVALAGRQNKNAFFVLTVYCVGRLQGLCRFKQTKATRNTDTSTTITPLLCSLFRCSCRRSLTCDLFFGVYRWYKALHLRKNIGRKRRQRTTACGAQCSQHKAFFDPSSTRQWQKKTYQTLKY